MKNYYEILEVSPNASQEVIEKAYKALVKKYHPDLQPTNKKQDSEAKIKEINEAYDILSNIDKKTKYDDELSRQKIREEQKKIAQIKKDYQDNSSKKTTEQVVQKQIIKKPKSPREENISQNYDLQNELNSAINEAYNNAYSNAYNEAYINTLKSMGYDIKYEKTFKDYIRNFFAIVFAIVVLTVVGFVLWHIPSVKNDLIELYNTNDIVRILVNIIHSIITAFISLFTKK